MTHPLYGADPQELEEFLRTAPDSVKDWADAQLAQLSQGQSTTIDADAQAPDADVEAMEFEEFLAEDPLVEPALDQDVPKKGRAHTAVDHDEPAAGAPFKPKPVKKSRSGSKINLVLVVLLVAAIVVIIQMSGQNPSDEQTPPHPMPTEMGQMGQPSQAPSLDSERVEQLKQQAEANPNDLAVKMELGKAYSEAALYQEAAGYYEQILAIDPDHVDATLSLGTMQFNMNNLDEAERLWLRSVELDPDEVIGYYNLGFLYLSKDPVDYDKVRANWEKVIEIDPDSEMAAAARGHLDSMGTPPSDAETTPGR